MNINISEIILAFFGSLLPSILFNTNPKRLPWVGFSGMIGWYVFTQARLMTGNSLFSSFTGAFAVGIYSEVMARMMKSPASIYSISGVFPLVPGISAYSTAESLVKNTLSEALRKFIETISSAGSIALGLMLALAVFRVLKRKAL